MKFRYLLLISILTYSLLQVSCRVKKRRPALKKPVLYLYPTEQTNLNVQLEIKGKLSHSYPKYNEQTGWDVLVDPDGNITDPQTEKSYYSLYWEANMQMPRHFKKGFVVSREETALFLEEQLAILGLNRREANEFIIYWLPQLEQNPYNLIHFATDSYTDRSELKITPKPETLIRVCMLFRPLSKPINIEVQQLKKVERKGFTAVEWGGMRIDQQAN